MKDRSRGVGLAVSILFLLAVAVLLLASPGDAAGLYQEQPPLSPVERMLLGMDWTKLAMGVVQVLIGWIVYEFRQWRKANQTSQQWLEFEEFVRRTVMAAEQLGLSEELAQFAETKLDYAVAQAEQWLDSRGIALDLEQVRVMVESEVRRMHLVEGLK